MKNKEINKLTQDELKNKFNLIKKDLFNIRFKKINGQLEDTSKVFHLKKSSTKLKHLLGPRFTYNYIPDIDQEDRLKIKSFDSVDGLAPTNTITYAFEQRLLKKFKTGQNKFQTD